MYPAWFYVFVVWWSAMCLAFRFVAPDACENYWYCTFAV